MQLLIYTPTDCVYNDQVLEPQVKKHELKSLMAKPYLFNHLMYI